ncbi:MAG: hypothetical protein OEW31_01005 [Thermoleophilia bacterium]|nr:hypothetical protein [Thermoleophilia bacterium]MDH5333718.1 hypothetical protein [Thermoleophilia bacterium]
MIRRRSRFGELVDRQLALFAVDEADLLEEAEAALDAWRGSGRESAEEAYGDYQLAVDAIADRLLEIRESYAATLAAGDDDEYRHALGRAVARRFRAHPSVVADLAEPG